MKKSKKEVKSVEAVEVNKAPYEKMLEIFENTCSLHTYENRLKWRSELAANGWTDEEFDAELDKRLRKESA